MDYGERRFTVYLAAGMGGVPGIIVLAGRKRAKEACIEADLAYIDPAEGENVPTDHTPVDLRLDYSTMKNYVAKDEYAIRHSDCLLVLTGDNPSDGTWWECGLAKFEVGIPVVMVAPRRCKGDLMGFSNVKADAIFPTVEEAVEFIATNFAEA